MNEDNPLSKEVDEFILAEIDTVPHLEAILLLWNSRPRLWSVEEMAQALYVPSSLARHILQSLTRRKLLVPERDNTSRENPDRNPDRFRYEPDSGRRDTLLQALDIAYRRDLIRISRMIHSKGGPALREFAEAFRFTKDRD